MPSSSTRGRHDGKDCFQNERDPHLERYFQECVRSAVTEFLSMERRNLSDIDLVFLPRSRSASSRSYGPGCRSRRNDV